MGRRSNPRSVKRAGAAVRRHLRRDIRRRARAQAGRLAIVALYWTAASIGLVALTKLTGGSDTTAAFFGGVAVGLVPFLYLTVLTTWGITHRQMGGEAEQWTASELARLDRRDWTVLHDVPLAYANVDHVAVGPGRVYAIETKWTTYATHAPALDRHARQTARQAQELARLLANHGTAHAVIPMLVMWGPDVATTLGARPGMRGEVRVVAGANADDWLARMRGAAAGDVAHDVIAALSSICADEAPARIAP